MTKWWLLIVLGVLGIMGGKQSDGKKKLLLLRNSWSK